jgi:16S rRNA (guanine527-N7)-methyltransferase
MFHVKHEGWSEWGVALGVDIGPETAAQLDGYEQLLLERGAPMGLIAPNDVLRVRERHLLDSLRAAPFAKGRTTAYDLGSGGGLPGLVLGIVVPELALTLVEVRRNRAAFLKATVLELGLENVVVYNRRAETLRERRDLCLARAFAPLARAWEAARPLLNEGGSLIYWAGSRFDLSTDLPEGARAQRHDSTVLPGSGALIELTEE